MCIFPPASAVNQRGRSCAWHLKVVILKPFCVPVLLSICPPPPLFLSIYLSQLLNEGLSALVIPGRGVFWRDEGCFFHPAPLVSPVLFALQETVMLPVPWVATAALCSPRWDNGARVWNASSLALFVLVLIAIFASRVEIAMISGMAGMMLLLWERAEGRLGGIWRELWDGRESTALWQLTAGHAVFDPRTHIRTQRHSEIVLKQPPLIYWSRCI